MTESLFENFTINKREMVFFINSTKWIDDGWVPTEKKDQKLPILYTTNKLGKHVFWRVYVNKNKIYRQSRNGVDGKIRVFPSC